MQEETTSRPDTIPIALTIAGSDSGGGAGIQADLKAMSANGVYGASVITAVTAQNTRAVTAVHEIPAEVVAAQMNAVLDDLSVSAIKIGMLFSPRIIETVAETLRDFQGAIVLDPVMIAKSGDLLLQKEAHHAMITLLLPRADLLTPNLPEAAVLLGGMVAETAEDTMAQARALLALGPKAVLLKGGHGKGDRCDDLLVTEAAQYDLSAPRQTTRNTHGTGCTYSAAIAANLAKGMEMPAAVRAAHHYLQTAIRAADDLAVGDGHGPVHHFAEVWGK